MFGPGAPLLEVVQGGILSERGVLLSVRCDLRGWELPGGNAHRGESPEQALRREILEETGVDVVVEEERKRKIPVDVEVEEEYYDTSNCCVALRRL